MMYAFALMGDSDEKLSILGKALPDSVSRDSGVAGDATPVPKQTGGKRPAGGVVEGGAEGGGSEKKTKGGPIVIRHEYGETGARSDIDLAGLQKTKSNQTAVQNQVLVINSIMSIPADPADPDVTALKKQGVAALAALLLKTQGALEDSS